MTCVHHRTYCSPPVGAVLLAAGAYDRLFAGNAAARYLASLDDDDLAEDEFIARLRQPFWHRAKSSLPRLGAAAAAAGHTAGRHRQDAARPHRSPA